MQPHGVYLEKIRFHTPQSCLELVPKNRPSAIGILDYLDNKCKLNPVSAASTPILLDEQTANIILEYLEKQRKKLKNNIRRIFSKKLKLQLKEVDRIKDLLNPNHKPNGTINLRTIGNNAGQHMSQNSVPKCRLHIMSSGSLISLSNQCIISPQWPRH